MTAFVVPCVSPSGSSRDRAPARLDCPRDVRSAPTSSARVWNANCEFGSPGMTRPATCPAWHAKHEIDRRPAASSTYWSGRPVGSPGRGVNPYRSYVSRRRSSGDAASARARAAGGHTVYRASNSARVRVEGR